MKQELTPAEKELYQRTDEVLFYLWDPIGVNECPEARDEYDGYTPHVFSMIIHEKSDDEISNYLISIEQDSMGIIVDEKSKTKVQSIVEILKNYKSHIEEKA